MAEYIERNKVLEKGICVGICDAQENMYGAADVVFIDDIKEITAADVEPVIHAYWIDTGYCGPHHMMIVQCSACKQESEGSIHDERCPHCGAHMDLKCETR